MPRRPEDVRDAEDVAALARYLFGDGVLEAARRRVSHVTSAIRTASGGLVTPRIAPGAPASAHDRFGLLLSRARADVIVVTGKVLRDEPGLRYDLEDGSVLGAALADFRRVRLGRPDPPRLVVLTSGRALDPSHPALRGRVAPLLYVPASAARAVEQRAAGLEVVGVPSPSLGGAIAWARDALKARGVSVEAGPTTTRALYASPRPGASPPPDASRSLVDELLLSVYLGPAPAADLWAGALPDEAALAALLPRGSAPREVEAPSGTWRFVRRTR